MPTYRLSLRLNLKPEHAGVVIDTIAPALKQAGLKFRNSAPGLIEGSGLSLPDLGLLLSRVAELTESPEVAEWLPDSGLLSDMWLHVSTES